MTVYEIQKYLKFYTHNINKILDIYADKISNHGDYCLLKCNAVCSGRETRTFHHQF